MYNYDFNLNEEIIINEEKNINIKLNQNYYLTNFILTNKNLLIFYDINRGSMLWGSGTHLLPEFELLLNIPIEKLKYNIYSGNLIITLNSIEINCYDFDIDNFLKNVKD